LYDGLGRRQQKTDPAGNVHSFVLGPHGQPFDEYVGSTWTRTTGGMFTYANSTTYFNHTDERGTPKLSTDYTGTMKRTEDSLDNIMGPFGDNFTETRAHWTIQGSRLVSGTQKTTATTSEPESTNRSMEPGARPTPQEWRRQT